jgi:shikimate kinase
MSENRSKIYLSGFMGAGKSRVGRTLRDKYGLPFYDTDAVIEEKAGKTVRLIFEEDGEEVFRNMEKQVIEELSQLDGDIVIALGGGAVMFDENRELMKKNGVIIYLKSSPESIYERVKHNKKRPLLYAGDVPDAEKIVLNRIKSMLEERAAYYEQADFVIERDGLEAEEVAAKILDFRKKLKKR